LSRRWPETSLPNSTATTDEVEHYLDLLDAREIVDAWTSADVEATKPKPDLVHELCERLEKTAAV
jgi:phosphoglycolate phosphatase-like HAD superfamily hydrolase